MGIARFFHDKGGLSLVYESDNRVIGLKNFQPKNSILKVDEFERHLETDEQFVLFCGSCLLVSMADDADDSDLEFMWMEQGILYSVPRGLWHATVMTADAKMMLIENSGTTFDNSERRKLSKKQLEIIQHFYNNQPG
jgi:ureidoglycolate hydrolase